MKQAGGYCSITQKEWFNEVTTATFDHFETAEQASEAERTAILTENPQYNGRVGNYAKQVSGSRGRIDHLNPTEAALVDVHRNAVKRIWAHQEIALQQLHGEFAVL
jgi:hypothetical protein